MLHIEALHAACRQVAEQVLWNAPPTTEAEIEVYADELALAAVSWFDDDPYDKRHVVAAVRYMLTCTQFRL